MAETVFNGVLVLNQAELKSIEHFVFAGFIVDVDALDDALKLALEPVIVGSSGFGLLHVSFEAVAEQAVELVHILLLIHFVVRPSEGLQQLKSANASVGRTGLKIVKNPLQAQKNRLLI